MHPTVNPAPSHPGYTCIPTAVLDGIIRSPFSAEELRVLLATVRLTMGHPPQPATEAAICALVNGRQPAARAAR